QGRDSAGQGPPSRPRVRRQGLSVAVRRCQGHHRHPLERPSFLPPNSSGSCLMNQASPSTAATSTVRCAVYTRKSSQEGLEQAFTSLQAQREAAEAYIASQQHAGWRTLPQHYDDGGYTGGNMDRPALAQLLHAIQAGQIDCVVVYKVDRFSRSLLDFAKM